MKRTPLQRGKPLTAKKPWWGPRKPLANGRRRAPRAENGSATWHRTRLWVIDRAKGRCEPKVADGCSGRAEHVHHMRLRSQGGSDDPSNLLAACNACHRWIHDHPAESARRGFIRRKESEDGVSEDRVVPPARGGGVEGAAGTR